MVYRHSLAIFALALFLLSIPFVAIAQDSKTDALRSFDTRILEAQKSVDDAERQLNDARASGNQQETQFGEQVLQAAKELLSSLLQQKQELQAPLRDSDLMCAPVKLECGCGKVKVCSALGGCKCVAGPNMWQCLCFQNIPNTDQVVTGTCVGTLNCKAQSFTNLQGQMQEVGGLGGVIGQIFQGALGQLNGLFGGGQGGIGAGNSNVCSTGNYHTVSSPSNDPCALYDPNAGESGGGGGRSGGGSSGGNDCSLVEKILGKCGADGTKCPAIKSVSCGSGFKLVFGGTGANGCKLQDTCEPITTIGTSTSSTQGTFGASPRSGRAPLTVSFTTNYGDATDTQPSFADGKDTVIDFGDGSTPQWLQCTNKQGSSGLCTASKTISHTYATNGTYTAAVKKTGGFCAGSCPETVLKAATITVTSSTLGDTSDALSAKPQSGGAPLAVVFTYANPVGADGCDRTVAVNHGDGTTYTPPQNCFTEHSHSHVYDTPGVYTVALEDITACANPSSQNCSRQIIAMASITVTEAQTQSQGKTQTQNTQINPSLYTQVVATSSNQTQYSGTLPSGTQGDIQVTGSGATVFGGSRDVTAGTEVAGFYGANTFGGEPQNVVARLCQTRPWASSIVSYVIPPTFFDGLCTWRGYSTAPPSATPVLPRATIVPQQSSQNPAVQAPETPIVPPKVDIWASPTRVPLGGRTSIFWNTQGVASCTVTSSAGNFSENTLSGGAATVPITGLTVFTISCMTPAGTAVTDTAEVDLAI